MIDILNNMTGTEKAQVHKLNFLKKWVKKITNTKILKSQI